MNKLTLIILSFIFIQYQGRKNPQIETLKEKELRQDALIKKYVYNCANKFNYNFQMQEWQNCLDEGIKVDFWQQKAMPYFKARKYEMGMAYLDKAVFYKPERWLSYRAFIKCIFSKSYKEALKDFELCVEMDGYSYVQDHTYQFHIALCYLQLNAYKKAAAIFKTDIIAQEKQWDEAHFLDIFYYGISQYEQGKWEEAIFQFDKSLEQYSDFSDAKYYKAICLKHLKRAEESKKLLEEAMLDAKNGNTINEANAIYEPYPYQVRW
jgi:tetratricopeptide (TPR) repeat protein